MAKPKTEILDDIEHFIAKHGKNPRQWYVGTSSAPKEKLFREHNFKKGDIGLIRQAKTELQAGEIAEFFTERGAKGGADIKPGNDFVYAYKIASHTKQ
jgi:hypothetical protein